MTDSERISLRDYHDRGIKKWAGFYLSEHTTAITDWQKKEYHSVPQKERLEIDEINQILHEAILKSRQISLQKEEVNLDGEYSEDLVGFIQGHDSLGIYLAGEKVGYDEIRHVEFFSFQKWSQL